VNGLADVYMTGYIAGPALGGRKAPLQLHGPRGTARLAEGLRLAHLSDVETRMLDEGIPEGGTQIDAHEAEQGVIFEKNGVKVIVFPVLHGERIKPSVGYRVDYKDLSVVFSGDTKYDENIIEFSKGVDLLVHEAGAAPLDMMEERVVKNVLSHHTSPEEAGRVFAQAEPDMVVYSHVVRMAGPHGRPTMREIVDRTRTTYSGPLVVGEDMMQFRIGGKGTSLLFGGK
jgi:ribonuclease Z